MSKLLKRCSSFANKAQVLAPLREDIEGVMNRSLRELGIDPEWKGIPNATFQSASATLQHQRSISQKVRSKLTLFKEQRIPPNMEPMFSNQSLTHSIR